MRTEILEAMKEIAEEKLSLRYAQVAKEIEVEVRNFGHGNRFDLKRGENGKLHAILYFHSSNSQGHFSETIEQAGKAATRILTERVRIKKETLSKLVAGHSLTPEEQEEISRLLS